MSTLHPELAKIAIRYDEVVELCKLNKLTNEKAYKIIIKLVARDDIGLYWSIDPYTGKWFYYSSNGLKIFSQPPAFGAINYDINILSSNEKATSVKYRRKKIRN
jgi:hypothetical protein